MGSSGAWVSIRGAVWLSTCADAGGIEIPFGRMCSEPAHGALAIVESGGINVIRCQAVAGGGGDKAVP